MIHRQPPAVPVRLAHDAVSVPAPVVLHMLRPYTTGLARLSMLCDMTPAPWTLEPSQMASC
jgi:hypothetical protein